MSELLLYSRPQVYEPTVAREAYYRRMAQRYRELAAGSPDLEMAECWRAAADECDELAEAMNASQPESHRTSMQRQPMQWRPKQRSNSNKRNSKTKPRLRKPTLVLSDIVGRTFALIFLSIRGSHRRHGRLACSVALSGQAPKPLSGAPKARGLTANARTELSFVWPRCAR